MATQDRFLTLLIKVIVDAICETTYLLTSKLEIRTFISVSFERKTIISISIKDIYLHYIILNSMIVGVHQTYKNKGKYSTHITILSKGLSRIYIKYILLFDWMIFQ